MSDLAPFVAAAIRDKVVVEMLEENENLRKQLRRARTVEITGPEGTPVYAQAQFDENGAYTDNSNLYKVVFPDEQLQPCPLSDLSDVEVRVGGICKAKFGNNSSFEGFLDWDESDDENGKVVNFCFAGGGELWLTVKVNGWPEERRQPATEQGVDTEHLLTYLLDVAVEEPLNKTISFKDVCFFARSVSGALKDLSLDQAPQKSAEESAEETLLLEVMHRMRSAGNQVRGTAFLSQAFEIERALDALNIHEPGEDFEEIVDRLIDFQAQTHDNEPGEQFNDIIQNIIAGTRDSNGNVDGGDSNEE